MLVTLLGITIPVKEVQYLNAYSPMLVTAYVLPLYVTLAGIVMLLMAVQLLKQLSPMVVKPWGKVILSSAMQ